jgi:WhiB family transcriptional regulator, redox-sensing transcriptional regulator
MREREDEIQAWRWITGGSWRSAGPCLGAGPGLLVPVKECGKGLEQAARAKALWAGCPVRDDCLAFAVRTRQAHGIWGGMTPGERAIAHRRLFRGAPRPA